MSDYYARAKQNQQGHLKQPVWAKYQQTDPNEPPKTFLDVAVQIWEFVGEGNKSTEEGQLHAANSLQYIIYLLTEAEVANVPMNEATVAFLKAFLANPDRVRPIEAECNASFPEIVFAAVRVFFLEHYGIEVAKTT